jgi:hypothetical protein
MREPIHFAPYFDDEALEDDQIQSMAVRQLSISTLVAVAFIAVAALIMLQHRDTVSATVHSAAIENPAKT